MDERYDFGAFDAEDIDPRTGLPFWGARMREELRSEIRSIGKQVASKPSKQWVKLTTGAAVFAAGSLVLGVFWLVLGDHKTDEAAAREGIAADLSDHKKEERENLLQVRTEIQGVGNRIERQGDTIIRLLERQGRQARASAGAGSDGN